MCRSFCSILLIFLTIGKIEYSAGLKWIPFKTGDKIPDNRVALGSDDKFIGRSRHFNRILPAEVYKNGIAQITSCDKIISKNQFEILTRNESCEWVAFKSYDQISEDIVQGGTDNGGVPIYIGLGLDDEDEANILYIFLGARSVRSWPNRSYYHSNFYYLTCKTQTEWVDTPSWKIPNKSVSGGKSKDGHEMFVARLQHDCEILTGYVIPENQISLAILGNGDGVESEYCQVLIGEPNEYTWETCSEGEIPDYAVVHGNKGKGLTYIARWNNTIGHLTQSEALHISDYDVLVKNEV